VSIASHAPPGDYRDPSTRERDDVWASVKNERGSTQPAIPRALIRRHVPLDSPSWTRELGPIDATRRESLLGPARTTTQPRETEGTQRAARDFDDGGAAVLAGALVPVGLAAIAEDADGGAASGTIEPLEATVVMVGGTA
jgi:hypothetical protein